jgi:outer membrane protein assembly factor BamE
MTKTIVLAIFLTLTLTGCGLLTPYKPNLQQGNVVTDAMVAKLHPGMTPDEVQAVMEGAPVLESVYDDHTTSYVYTYEPSKGKLTEKKLLLTFKDNKLENIRT